MAPGKGYAQPSLPSRVAATPGTTAAVPVQATLGEAILRRAVEPDTPAVRSPGRTWTYGDLSTLADAMQARVAERDIGQPVVVAVQAGEPALLAVAVVATAAAATAAPLAGPARRPASRPVGSAGAGVRARRRRARPRRPGRGGMQNTADPPPRGSTTRRSSSPPPAAPRRRSSCPTPIATSASAQGRPRVRDSGRGSPPGARVDGARSAPGGHRRAWRGATVLVANELAAQTTADAIRDHRPTCLIAPPPAPRCWPPPSIG